MWQFSLSSLICRPHQSSFGKLSKWKKYLRHPEKKNETYLELNFESFITLAGFRNLKNIYQYGAYYAKFPHFTQKNRTFPTKIGPVKFCTIRSFSKIKLLLCHPKFPYKSYITCYMHIYFLSDICSLFMLNDKGKIN